MTTTDHPQSTTTGHPQVTSGHPQVTSGQPQVTTSGRGPDEAGRGYRSKPEHLWTAFDRCEAYLDSRPVGGPYNPAAEYGDPDWREPESDDEAQARTDHLAAQPRDQQTLAWIERLAAISEQDRALVDAEIALTHAQATHDPDEIAVAYADYQAELAASYARDREEPREPEHTHDEQEAEL